MAIAVIIDPQSVISSKPYFHRGRIRCTRKVAQPCRRWPATLHRKVIGLELGNHRNRELFQAHDGKANITSKSTILTLPMSKVLRMLTKCRTSREWTGCSLLHQIVPRQRTGKQPQRRSLHFRSMITISPCSSIRTLLLFSPSKVANREPALALV